MEKLESGGYWKYIKKLFEIINKTVATWRMPYENEYPPALEDVLDCVINSLLKNLKGNKKVMAIGNGGSAAIAMHILVDYANAGGLRTLDLNGPAMLTCMANDYGYENVFAKPVELFAETGDMLFAISSSGKSPNILKACEMADKKGCYVITLSGFDADNPLRKAGHVNFYVPSMHYGFVEIAHQALVHCILDLFVERKKSE